MPMSDSTIDVHFLGRPHLVAVEVLGTPAGPVLLDTGPGSTLAALKTGLAARGIAVADLHGILLSHIHFDHAGATGELVAENPRLAVYVHEIGAVHLVEPSRLIAGATRIYRQDMDRLWGRFLPVPAANIRDLRGGERIEVGGRRFEVAYTPGHAVHHLSYFDPANGTAYVGDAGGIRLPSLPIRLPVTPPEDYSLEQWIESLDTILAWRPARLFSTHFGPADNPADQLDELRRGLHHWTDLAAQILGSGHSDESCADQFHRTLAGWLSERADLAAIRTLADFSDFRASFHGIAGYLKRSTGGRR